MIIQLLGAFFAVASLSVLFGVPKKYIFYSALTGTVGQMIYFLVLSASKSALFGVFAGAVVVTFIAHIMARLSKTPVTVFLIPGIIPTVPGLDMYRAVYNIIIGQNHFAQLHLIQALKLAGMIALGIFIIDALFGLKKTNNK